MMIAADIILTIPSLREWGDGSPSRRSARWSMLGDSTTLGQTDKPEDDGVDENAATEKHAFE
ncbi:MAG: hypothetical protein GXP17_07190 [Gammaproteobacteria bacterium]|nr:hypothetical protein [Gammaproteobacteria bacterium]